MTSQTEFWICTDSVKQSLLTCKLNVWQTNLSHTIFTFFNTAATSTKNCTKNCTKTRPSFDIEEQFLTPYFHNRLWVPQVQELTVKKACKANAWPLHSCYSTWPSYDYAVSIASPLEISLKASKYCVKTASFIAWRLYLKSLLAHVNGQTHGHMALGKPISQRAKFRQQNSQLL